MLKQEIRESPVAEGVRPRNRGLIGAVIVLVLAVIGLGAWTIVENNQTAEVAVVGGGPLTERQQEMVALVTGPWIEAWRTADGEAVAAFYTPDGVAYDVAGNRVLRVDDGTLADFASAWEGIDLEPGMLVHDNRIILVAQLAGVEVGGILEFTPVGDLVIESQTMYDSALSSFDPLYTGPRFQG